MMEKIIVGLLMAGAVVGMVMWIRREQQPGRCEGGCEECPLMGSGCSGKSGKSGDSGNSGNPGIPGNPGYSGQSGQSGNPGNSGENRKKENEKD